jgi:hypothetical protein
MKIIKAHSFELRGKVAQERLLRRWSGGLRWLWNKEIQEQ